MTSKNVHQFLLSPNETRRAIYIDFEGNRDLAPTLLGVLKGDIQGTTTFHQQVFEEGFWNAADAHGDASTGGHCITASLHMTIEELVLEASQNDRLIVAWSEHELDVVQAYSRVSPKVLDEFDCRYRSGIPTAKRLKQTDYPTYKFPPPPKKGYVPLGTHSLQNYLRMIGYDVPAGSRAGLTGKNLKYLRSELLRKNGQHSLLTATSKSKWTRVLSHNFHDCHGMRELMLRATS
jgi:hypothetical protein